jgi:hypothetical protein
MVLVVAAIPAPFHWAQLRELLLPVTEHVRFNATQLTDFTYGEVAFGGNQREVFLQGNQCAVEESYEFTLSRKQLQTIANYFFEKRTLTAQHLRRINPEFAL